MGALHVSFRIGLAVGALVAAAVARGACQDGFYVSLDHNDALVARHSKQSVVIPASAFGIETALRPESAIVGTPVSDCSERGIKCIRALDFLFAFKPGGRGETYRIAETTFTISNSYKSSEVEPLFWVEFRRDASNGERGTFLYSGSRGIISFQRRFKSGQTVSLSLVQGNGLLATSCGSR